MNQAACGPHLSYIPQRLGIPYAPCKTTARWCARMRFITSWLLACMTENCAPCRAREQEADMMTRTDIPQGDHQ